jgi:hypothetical protein
MNQAFAMLGWALVAVWLALQPWQELGRAQGIREPLVAALAMAGAALGSVWTQGTSAFTVVGLASAAWLLVVAARVAEPLGVRGVLLPFMGAMLASALLQATLGVCQLYLPDAWRQGLGLAEAVAGRASGQLRQPNHLSTLLMWGMVAAAWVMAELLNRARAGRHGAWWLIWLLVQGWLAFGLVLTASRTGLIGVGVLALWGLMDRRLPGRLRVSLLALPVLYALAWAGVQAQTAAAPAGVHLPAGGDISSSRFGIWANTWELIKANPWWGVGWGEFNFAWTLTPFPTRPVAFFDHTHNLPLQLAVELGIPAALLVCSLLLWGLWRAFVCSGQVLATGDIGPRCAFMMVLLVGLHSLLEYPLWYSYFLLPTAFAWGCALRRAPATPKATLWTRPRWWRVLPGGLMLAGSLHAMWDYQRIVAIYTTQEGELPLAMRIEQGKKSPFLAHQAWYAEATVDALHGRPADALPAIRAASHHLIDTRLLMAWIRALVDAGEVDKARYLTERLREFRNPASAEFLAACDSVSGTRPPRVAPEAESARAVTGRPAYCAPPERTYSFKDFR